MGGACTDEPLSADKTLLLIGMLVGMASIGGKVTFSATWDTSGFTSEIPIVSPPSPSFSFWSDS